MNNLRDHSCDVHRYRIYCYLLRLTRDKVLAITLTENVFTVLISINEYIRDSEHLLRCLYLLARISYLLQAKGKMTVRDLKAELIFYTLDDPNIMEDPEVAKNETLIALQAILQKMPARKREIAELYFFQRLSMPTIVDRMGLSQRVVREQIFQVIRWLSNELSGEQWGHHNPWLGDIRA